MVCTSFLPSSRPTFLPSYLPSPGRRAARRSPSVILQPLRNRPCVGPSFPHRSWRQPRGLRVSAGGGSAALRLPRVLRLLRRRHLVSVPPAFISTYFIPIPAHRQRVNAPCGSLRCIPQRFDQKRFGGDLCVRARLRFGGDDRCGQDLRRGLVPIFSFSRLCHRSSRATLVPVSTSHPKPEA